MDEHLEEEADRDREGGGQRPQRQGGAGGGSGEGRGRWSGGRMKFAGMESRSSGSATLVSPGLQRDGQ